MEIRSECAAMADTAALQQVEVLRPASPCDSEISVGFEAQDETRTSVEMTVAEDEGETEVEPRSPSTSRGAPSPAPSSGSPHTETSFTYLSDDEYFRPLKRLAMSESSPPPPEKPAGSTAQRHNESPRPESCEPVLPEAPQPRVNVEQKSPGLRSFTILDILSYKPSRRKSSVPVKIVRPWDTREDSTGAAVKCPQEVKKTQNDKGSALDALFKMTNKTLDNLNKEDKSDAVNLFSNRQAPKKKRKSRTAFTNHQIFELEKRFLYQKYLSPADRDELAQSLGLSNAQVITWFQNRRAKLKRDMEELKRDVQSSKCIPNSKAFLEASVNVAALLKAKELPKIQIATLPH